MVNPDYGDTAAIFQATALRVQNLLSEITPNTPDAYLPSEFNAWLNDLVQTYPAGCTYGIIHVLLSSPVLSPIDLALQTSSIIIAAA
jgi:hypothetical protein